MTLGDALVKIGFNVDQSSSNAATAKFKQIKSTAVKLLGAIGIGFSFSAMNSLAEEFNGINDSIRAATRDMGEQLDIQQQIMEAANATKVSYSDMAGTITQLIQTDGELFSDLETATDFATLTAKTLKAAGRSDSEVSSAQSQLNRVIAAGSMEASTFTRILRTYPELINTMADGLGVTTDELQAMCEAGQVTSKTMVQAFSNASDTIDSDFGELDYSISDALTNIRNQWGLFVDQLWTGSNITNGVGTMMVNAFSRFLAVLKKLQPLIERVARALLTGFEKALSAIDKVAAFVGGLIDRFGGIENAAKTLAIVLGSIWLALNAGKILSFLNGLKGFFTVANLKILGIIAVIALLGLIVEDFINFLQGNDSVLGTAFDSLGIDSEEVRKTVLGAFGQVAGFFEENLPQIQATFETVWGTISTVVSTVMNAVWGVIQSVVGLIMAIWERWGTQITTIVSTVMGLVGTLFLNGLSIISGVANMISALLNGDVSGAFEALKGVVRTVWNNICSILRAGWTVISNLFQIGAGLITGILSAVFEGVSGIVSDIASSIMDGIQEAIDWITGLPEQALQWGSDIIQKIIDGVSSVIGDIYTTVSEGMQEAIDWITGLPEQALEWGADIIGGIADGITGAIGTVTEAVKGIGEGITSFLGFSVPDEGPLSDFQSWMPDFMGGLASGIQSSEGMVIAATRSMATAIADAVKDGMQAAIDWMEQLPAQAAQWGADIINGLVGGIRGAMGTLTSAVKGIADTITSFLHFSAPDKGPLAGYESWMPDFMAGLAAGINGSSGAVMDSVRGLASDIAMLGQSATASVGTALSGAVTNNATTDNSVTQNVNISNSYSGNADAAARKVTSTMKKSAADTTTYLARALAYGKG